MAKLEAAGKTPRLRRIFLNTAAGALVGVYVILFCVNPWRQFAQPRHWTPSPASPERVTEPAAAPTPVPTPVLRVIPDVTRDKALYDSLPVGDPFIFQGRQYYKPVPVTPAPPTAIDVTGNKALYDSLKPGAPFIWDGKLYYKQAPLEPALTPAPMPAPRPVPTPPPPGAIITTRAQFEALPPGAPFYYNGLYSTKFGSAPEHTSRAPRAELIRMPAQP